MLNIKIDHERFNGKRVRSLEIRNGEALFYPNGGVVVKMPGSDEFWTAFKPMRVLEIRDLKGKLLARNYYLCTKCACLTGEMKVHKHSETFGRIDAKFKCTKCNHQWELKGI